MTAGRARSFFACDDTSHQGNTNTWLTPKEIFEMLKTKFDLDPCTQSSRPFDTAKKNLCEDMGQDGLTAPWHGRVWLNPPYGREIKPWLKKLQTHGNGIALVLSRTETLWAQDCLRVVDAVNFIKGRLSFIRQDGSASTNAANGSMLLAFGQDNAEVIKGVPGIVFCRSNFSGNILTLEKI